MNSDIGDQTGRRRQRRIETTIGALTLVGEGDTLTGIYYDGHWTAPNRSAFGTPDPSAFAAAERQLHDYLAGRRTGFALDVALRGSAFRRAVWDEIVAIPYGQTRTYTQLAARLGRGTHPRAVGGAVGANPLSIVVPCHRVVGSDGRLTGYAGGLERKRALLSLEGVAVTPSGGPPGASTPAVRSPSR